MILGNCLAMALVLVPPHHDHSNNWNSTLNNNRMPQWHQSPATEISFFLLSLFQVVSNRSHRPFHMNYMNRAIIHSHMTTETAVLSRKAVVHHDWCWHLVWMFGICRHHYLLTLPLRLEIKRWKVRLQNMNILTFRWLISTQRFSGCWVARIELQHFIILFRKRVRVHALTPTISLCRLWWKKSNVRRGNG